MMLRSRLCAGPPLQADDVHEIVRDMIREAAKKQSFIVGGVLGEMMK